MTTDLEARTALAEDLRFLARRHPRATWAGHARLGALARFWLERHALFRRLDQIIRTGCEGALVEPVEPPVFKAWLARHLQALLWELEGHHQVEDAHYFPVFRRVEPRLARGFELLERDHEALHLALGGVVTRANRVLAHEDARAPALGADLELLRAAHVALGRALLRHLDDEEDLVVPLLIERGEHVVPDSG